MPRSPLIIALATFSFLFVVGQFFFVPKTALNSVVLTALSAPRVFFSALRNKHKLVTQLSDLAIENQALRGELAGALSLPRIIEESKQEYLRAIVYSSYPLTSAKTLTIGAGAAQGVGLGMPVVVKPGLFIGEVWRVFGQQSSVHTVFDSAESATSTVWQLSVKVGKNNTDALLIAGLEPRLTIISRKKGVTVGDEVRLAGKQYPYGLSIGTVGAVIDDPGNIFLEATLAVPYSIADLDELFVILPKKPL